ncbi:hypothetical protein EVAR_103782_1 [Eumeta japonica]|uniref:Uncharacterized protein n=1 Tax=Eumeta variegata TaxID=151549 RepID=A0A4C1Z4E5_EUMVA|nr:hypothetical protein EVAR_103782_1 [Eumeta japonica]
MTGDDGSIRAPSAPPIAFNEANGVSESSDDPLTSITPQPPSIKYPTGNLYSYLTDRQRTSDSSQVAHIHKQREASVPTGGATRVSLVRGLEAARCLATCAPSTGSRHAGGCEVNGFLHCHYFTVW